MASHQSNSWNNIGHSLLRRTNSKFLLASEFKKLSVVIITAAPNLAVGMVPPEDKTLLMIDAK